MNHTVSKTTREILAEDEQVRLLQIAVKEELQKKINQTCKTHTERFSQ